jgi:hypothetical protein
MDRPHGVPPAAIDPRSQDQRRWSPTVSGGSWIPTPVNAVDLEEGHPG